jgi:hypothetical protein
MNITLILIMLCLALLVFMFIYFRWYIKRHTSAERLLPEYRKEVNALIADIDAATDRDSLLVEDRIKKLTELLDDTDKRIAVYVKELEKSRAGEEMYKSLGRTVRKAPVTTYEAAGGQAQLSLFMSSLEQQKPPEPKKVPESAAAGGVGASKKQIRAQIDLLAGEGLSAEEIASRLGISIAEADLAMNLINRKTMKN